MSIIKHATQTVKTERDNVSQSKENFINSKRGSVGGKFREFKRQFLNLFRSKENHIFRETHQGNKLKDLQKDFVILRSRLNDEKTTLLDGDKKHYKTVNKINKQVSTLLQEVIDKTAGKNKGMTKKEKEIFDDLIQQMETLKKECDTRVEKPKSAIPSLDEPPKGLPSDPDEFYSHKKSKEKTSPQTSSGTSQSGDLAGSEEEVEESTKSSSSHRTTHGSSASQKVSSDRTASSISQSGEDSEEVEDSTASSSKDSSTHHAESSKSRSSHASDSTSSKSKASRKKEEPTETSLDPLSDKGYTILTAEQKAAVKNDLNQLAKELMTHRFLFKGNNPKIEEIETLRTSIRKLIARLIDEKQTVRINDLKPILDKKTDYADSEDLQKAFVKLEDLEAV